MSARSCQDAVATLWRMGATEVEHDVLAFFVRNPITGVQGYCWRFWSDRTSFYGKIRYAPFADIKINHEPSRERQAGLQTRPRLLLQLAAEEAGGAAIASAQTFPLWYSGRPIRRGVTHVARVRHPWTLFHKGMPSAPTPSTPKGKVFAGVVKLPDEMRVVDVDLYVCQERPYWPKEAQARADEAALGPLRNASGEYLTGVIHHRWFDGPQPQAKC